jgi:hypothetical protein
VRCPVCRAKPMEKCTLMTGHPSNKAHLARGLTAAKAPHPESSGHAALRFLRAPTSRSFRGLFQHLRGDMTLKRNNPPSPMSFQIHKNGRAVDGISYPSLEEASAALEKAAQGGEVNLVDRLDQVVRRYTLNECRNARNSWNKA